MPFVVWVPQLGAQRDNVPAGAALVTDGRAHQYWDATGWLGEGYGRVLQTPEDAWDVYLLYGRGRVWNGVLPPKPDYWMHQLSRVTSAPHLDPEVLRRHVEQLLGA